MKSKRLTGIIWSSLTIIYIMFAAVIVYLWAGEKILNANSQIKNIRQNYLNSQKNIIKTNTGLELLNLINIKINYILLPAYAKAIHIPGVKINYILLLIIILLNAILKD